MGWMGQWGSERALRWIRAPSLSPSKQHCPAPFSLARRPPASPHPRRSPRPSPAQSPQHAVLCPWPSPHLLLLSLGR